ncbi:putative oxidoreductase, aryl-alcohol dehydrogenase like protein [Schinkia azotoformans MEV2011]|uniref:Putative oxidoreductase, aryl-alcohol dehydrogenase like protein n=1 Tax=Schinkia azotoformans MEV2011 TaxID=1348973 RepID=A0A072NKZ0_SCHAZ|nr:aldo/keto reductase [Schinkia azotoformans]KEF37937.1 putative oxidoreductase, aryl-alcohol dehydrogenase like protein [Schinkia azotoformans MEV2011]MEC1696296.1 aldo/keto reductase [Schinkia azotoformans]MEC1727254.1 aldo/keto reductase [Schinkia azotoformans]MEC1770822.1 aldo/keto reductase [Schinkia azotoformans]MEC1780814.1 aldo/keto reductase [Schinkia azotoformans]
MKKNQLGTSDLYISEIGLGCMSLGTDVEKGIRIIHEALHTGVNFLDTADLYDFGINEEIVGKAIKGRRGEVIVATKVGNRWNENKDSWIWDPSANYIKAEVKESLRRLQTDYVDLYQLHGGTIEDPIDETIAAFEDLKKEGLIRHYGISSIRPNVINEFVKKANIVSVMMQYSLLDRRPEELFPLLKEKQISIIARGPLAKGLLTEKIKDKTTAQVFEKGYLDYSYEEISKINQKIQDLLISPQTINSVALRYPLFNETVASIIPGASSIEQLKENVIDTTNTQITKEQYDKLQTITKPSAYQQHRI